MKVSYPAYYKKFHCLAGSCPDSCCKEWAVVVDPQAQQRYKTLPGPLGEELRTAMTLEDDDVILALTQDRRCPMWRQDGLCRIQDQLGEEGLCQTCRQFPRLRHDYGDFLELGLELSCPEAARLILSGQHREKVTREQPGETEVEYEPQDMALLLHSREQALGVLEQEEFAPGEALAVLLMLGYHTQEQLDGAEQSPFDSIQALKEARSLASGGDWQGLVRLYRKLEILTEAWRLQLEAPAGGSWCREHRAMARYLVERYWLQAISDLDLVCRVKFILASCLLVRHLGGEPEVTAQRYSKEIENDAQNLDALLDGAYLEPALADVRLLDLLLNR